MPQNWMLEKGLDMVDVIGLERGLFPVSTDEGSVGRTELEILSSPAMGKGQGLKVWTSVAVLADRKIHMCNFNSILLKQEPCPQPASPPRN